MAVRLPPHFANDPERSMALSTVSTRALKVHATAMLTDLFEDLVLVDFRHGARETWPACYAGEIQLTTRKFVWKCS